MTKTLVVSLCFMFFVILLFGSSRAADIDTLVGQKLFTRANLKAKGKVIVFHNISAAKGFIPVGTAVIIEKVGKEKIKFRLAEGGERYVLITLPGHYDRYFVKSAEEIGLKGISDKIKGNIQNMTIAKGMTKEEVYIARGCPGFIGHGEKSWFYTLDQIMESDSWHYYYNSRKLEMIVKFENGVVVEIE